jgi:hypothetical protein
MHFLSRIVCSANAKSSSGLNLPDIDEFLIKFINLLIKETHMKCMIKLVFPILNMMAPLLRSCSLSLINKTI